MHPFNVVEGRGFREFVEALNPNYVLPSRHLISKTLIPATYEACVNNIKTLIQRGKVFCITTDSWSSLNTINFVAITAHFVDDEFNLNSILLECSASDYRHTSSNLATELRRVVTDWGIERKIILAVSDNAANIQKAIQQEVGWKHLGCVAHTINLIVKDSLKNENIQDIIAKIREVVKHFRKSNIANDKLIKYQENLGKNPLKLILEVPTRWNSTFYMLQRFVNLEECIRSTVAVIDKELPVLTSSEWQEMKQLCQVLKPLESATRTLSGENYCTASLVIPMYNGMKKVFENLSKQMFSPAVLEVVQLIRSGLEERLGTVENSNTLTVCTFLDPRFKYLGFSKDILAENVKKRIIPLIAEKITFKTQERQSRTPPSPSQDTETEADDTEMSIWSDFDKTVFAAQPKGTSTSRAIIEMQRYMEEDIVPRQQDAFKWWAKNGHLFPNLAEVAQEKLCALASSVPCERLFSKAGQILTDRRNRLSDKKVQMLLFLNQNQKYI